MMAIIKQFYLFWQRVALQFVDDGCMSRAAALTYTTLLSLVPLMTVSFTILKAFPVFQEAGAAIQAFVFDNFVAASAGMVEQHLQAFAKAANQLSAPGLLFLLVVAVLMIFNMEASFNQIWRVKRHRRGVQAFLMYWAILTLLPVLIGVALAISSYVLALPWFVGNTVSLALKRPLLAYLPVVLTFIAFTLLYITVPNCKVKFKYAMLAGLLTTLLFELAKFAFGLYILYFPTYRLLYGALAVIPIFLIWIYLSWLVILFGAVVCSVLGRPQERSH